MVHLFDILNKIVCWLARTNYIFGHSLTVLQHQEIGKKVEPPLSISSIWLELFGFVIYPESQSWLYVSSCSFSSVQQKWSLLVFWEAPFFINDNSNKIENLTFSSYKLCDTDGCSVHIWKSFHLWSWSLLYFHKDIEASQSNSYNFMKLYCLQIC